MHGMYCKTQYRMPSEGFELFIKPRLRGNILHEFRRDHRQMAWGREPKRGKPTPCLAGGISLILSKHPIRNYQCTLVGIKNSNDWEISKEKSKLEIGNVHIRKVKFSKEKCTYWKSK